MKPHVFAQMVNEVRDLSQAYGSTEQFRDRVSEVLGKYIPVDHGKAVPDTLSQEQEIEIIRKYSQKEEWPEDGVSDDFMDLLRWGLQIGIRYCNAP